MLHISSVTQVIPSSKSDVHIGGTEAFCLNSWEQYFKITAFRRLHNLQNCSSGVSLKYFRSLFNLVNLHLRNILTTSCRNSCQDRISAAAKKTCLEYHWRVKWDSVEFSIMHLAFIFNAVYQTVTRKTDITVLRLLQKIWDSNIF